MAEIKWIKICTDIFDDEKILLIESNPEKDSIIVIWFKLLCLAGKQNNNGVFIVNDKIAYTDEMLATIFRRPLETVKLALDVFEQYGMIEIINGTITIPKWEKHQNIGALEKYREDNRKRVAKHRQKQKNIINTCNVTDNVTVTLCNATDKKEDKKEDKKYISCPNSDDLDVNDDISKFKPKNVITVNKADAIAHIYKAYPRKESKTKGVDYALEYLTGRKIAGLGTFKYNHEQIYCAVREYAIECEEKFTEKRYIKLFSSFMNGTIIDYVEQSAKGYEDYMQRTYGDEWRNIKFNYIP
ncbi:MAG: hypothetical protein E7508_05940 [Ruminococcus sp.]|nr:hypothetical protein [Ruminococcus sp.]